MGVESLLDNVFAESARQEEKEMQGKVYNYKFYKGFMMDELAKKGKCIVKSRRYNRGCDCDVITVIDCNTGETFLANQFAITLKEVC